MPAHPAKNLCPELRTQGSRGGHHAGALSLLPALALHGFGGLRSLPHPLDRPCLDHSRPARNPKMGGPRHRRHAREKDVDRTGEYGSGARALLRIDGWRVGRTEHRLLPDGPALAYGCSSVAAHERGACATAHLGRVSRRPGRSRKLFERDTATHGGLRAGRMGPVEPSVLHPRHGGVGCLGPLSQAIQWARSFNLEK